MRTSIRTVDTPKTDAELFDYLHAAFGWGTYDDLAVRDVPWWKVRGQEIGKIKRSRFKRKIPIATLVLTADFCVRHHITVRNITSLYRHIYDAEVEQRLLKRTAESVALDDLIAEAVAHERASGGSAWMDRLLRAQGAARKEVLAEWKRERAL